MKTDTWFMLFDRVGWVCMGILLGQLVTKIQDCWLPKLHHFLGESHHHMKDQRGIMSHRWTANIALGIVVLITAFAAFQSQQASNDSEEALKQNTEGAACTYTTLFGVVNAASPRTEFSVAQAQANIRLQKAQADYLTLYLDPSHRPTPEEARAALVAYFRALTHFVQASSDLTEVLTSNPYPTPQEYLKCLRNAGIVVDKSEEEK